MREDSRRDRRFGQSYPSGQLMRRIGGGRYVPLADAYPNRGNGVPYVDVRSVFAEAVRKSALRVLSEHGRPVYRD